MHVNADWVRSVVGLVIQASGCLVEMDIRVCRGFHVLVWAFAIGLGLMIVKELDLKLTLGMIG